MKTIPVLLLAMIFTVCAIAENPRPLDIKSAARSALVKWEKAVVTVKVVAKMKTPRGDEENQLEVTGSVIDPSGLTIVSAQSIDPVGMVKAFLASVGRSTPPDQLKIESDITQTTMILQDGSEVEAEVVLKDADLDCAFVRPSKSDQQFTYIPMKPGSKPLEMLEDVFVIRRMDRSANRATAISLGTVQAVVKGPRTYFITNQELAANSLGCMVFGADGEPKGIVVTKAKQNTGDKGMSVLMSMMMGSGLGGGSVQIVRPLSDLLEDVAQAREAKIPQSAPTQSAPNQQ